MCRATPARVVRIEGDQAWVESGGGPVAVSLLDAAEQVRVGDYVLAYAGVVVQRLEPEEAESILSALAELDGMA